MTKITFYKIFILCMILCFLTNQIFAENINKKSSEISKKFNFKKNQIIEFKLSNGERIIIKYIYKTDKYIFGDLVEFDQGNYVTKKDEIKIVYGEIEKYRILQKKSLKTTVIFFSALTLFFLIIYALEKHSEMMNEAMQTLN